jgi:hypothetical protein
LAQVFSSNQGGPRVITGMGLMLLEAYAQITFVHIFATEPLRHFPIFWTGVSFSAAFSADMHYRRLFLLGSFGYVKREDVVSL